MRVVVGKSLYSGVAHEIDDDPVNIPAIGSKLSSAPKGGNGLIRNGAIQRRTHRMPVG